MKAVFFLGQAGCLLPALILVNLFFGWMFLSTSAWLATGGFLIVLFFVNSFMFMRRVTNLTKSARSKRPGAIDVEAEVVKGKEASDD